MYADVEMIDCWDRSSLLDNANFVAAAAGGVAFGFASPISSRYVHV